MSPNECGDWFYMIVFWCDYGTLSGYEIMCFVAILYRTFFELCFSDQCFKYDVLQRHGALAQCCRQDNERAVDTARRKNFRYSHSHF